MAIDILLYRYSVHFMAFFFNFHQEIQPLLSLCLSLLSVWMLCCIFLTLTSRSPWMRRGSVAQVIPIWQKLKLIMCVLSQPISISGFITMKHTKTPHHIFILPFVQFSSTWTHITHRNESCRSNSWFKPLSRTSSSCRPSQPCLRCSSSSRLFASPETKRRNSNH